MNRSNSAADSLRLGIIATGAAAHVRKAPAEQIIMFLLRHLKGTARRRQDGAVSPDCQDVLHIPVIHHPAQVVITSTVRQEHRLATGRVFLMRPKKEQCLQPLLHFRLVCNDLQERFMGSPPYPGQIDGC